ASSQKPLSHPLMILITPLYLAVFSSTLAIEVYTHKEIQGIVGSEVTLYCSFWSREYITEDATLSWSFRPDGARDSISIFHYSSNQEFPDTEGTFKDRIEWVGNMNRKDGTIIIKNLDYNDNGTFTCDAKNPPDIVGSPSSVRLVVYDRAPLKAGVVTGAIIGAFLGLVLVIVALVYFVKFLLRKPAFPVKDISVVEKGKAGKPGKAGSQLGRQSPLYATVEQLTKGKSLSDKKSKGTTESKKDKK
uniref:Myelin protein P0 n=1 Tax=Latimeria chalumnae TaxID=7897 RepID=H3AWQ5_LATCH